MRICYLERLKVSSGFSIFAVMSSYGHESFIVLHFLIFDSVFF